MKNKLNWIALPLIIITILLIIMDWLSVSSSYARILEENNRLYDLNRQLRMENLKLQNAEQRMKELDDRINSIRSRGYRPDTLLVRQYQILSEKFPSLCTTAIDTFTMKESSYRHGRTGIFGEIGALQLKPETLKHYIAYLGGDTTDFRIEDYSDLRTSTEWAYVIMFHLKWKKKELLWKDWNRGW